MKKPDYPMPAIRIEVSYCQEGTTLVHVLLIEGTAVYGAENLTKKFTSPSEWTMFIQLINTMNTGVYGEFSWTRIL